MATDDQQAQFLRMLTGDGSTTPAGAPSDEAPADPTPAPSPPDAGAPVPAPVSPAPAAADNPAPAEPAAAPAAVESTATGASGPAASPAPAPAEPAAASPPPAASPAPSPIARLTSGTAAAPGSPPLFDLGHDAQMMGTALGLRSVANRLVTISEGLKLIPALQNIGADLKALGFADAAAAVDQLIAWAQSEEAALMASLEARTAARQQQPPAS